ncbi:MAG: hypothetical protein ICV60_00340 [Pyrinomonadaceae bacterium]|nr:hypothetical protein [Pyrinomonadaceae bacterium]
MRRESRREHNPVKAKSEEAATLASSLAPLEELGKRGSKNHPNGSIVLDTAELKVPKDFIEEEAPNGGLGLEPVVIFIIALALAFIAFITYLISIEPPK